MPIKNDHLLERKVESDKIASLYEQIGYHKYAQRIKDCATNLLLVQKRLPVDSHLTWVVDERERLVSTNDEIQLRLKRANFCRCRLCPICQWRKSVRWRALMLRDLPKVIEDYPNTHWLFLTLTIKNPPLVKLHETIKHLNASFLRLINHKNFPALGWIKCIEVSLPVDDETSCHPHLHCLLLVEDNYFDPSNYWHQKEWVRRWQQAACLDYQPIVDIRKVYDGFEVIPELMKYGVKPSSLSEITGEQLDILTVQSHKVRAVSKGGVLRGYFRDKSAKDDDISDYIGTADDGAVATGWEISRSWVRDGYHSTFYLDGQPKGFCSETANYSDEEVISYQDS